MRALVPAFLERPADEILAAGPRVVGFAAAVPMDEIPTPRFDEYFERLAKTAFAEEGGRYLALPLPDRHLTPS